MSIFSRGASAPKGFDSLIAKGVSISGADTILIDGVLQVDGTIGSDQFLELPDKPATLRVAGSIAGTKVSISNVLVSGEVLVDELRVEGTLTVGGSGVVKAKVIYYRLLALEPGCVVMGEMKHLDHVSEGEVV